MSPLAVYRANRPHAEVCLLYPRSHVHAKADVAAVAKFREIGFKLLDDHVLFDVRPDFDQICLVNLGH